MRFLPGLTSTDRTAITAFVRDLAASETRAVALFPTCLERGEREALYRDLEAIKGLRLPHVHLRSDMGLDELDYLKKRFATEVFNIHARGSLYPYGRDPGSHAVSIYVENADSLPVAEELVGLGGLCLDFAHWESARLLGRPGYEGFGALAAATPIGCCHISAIRPGVRSAWGGFDHHRFSGLGDLDYVLRYRAFFPRGWASLELENGLGEQLAAIARLETLLERAQAGEGSRLAAAPG